MAMSPKSLPPTFTSAYRLFLRAVSASVLHHRVAKRQLRTLWRPTFREAAKVLHRMSDMPLVPAERRRCEAWMEQWDQNLNNTLSLLLTSAQSRGLPHKLTRNLSFLHFGYHEWVKHTVFKPRERWDPSPEKYKKSSEPRSTKAEIRERKARDALKFDSQAWGALEETIKMAETSSGIFLGRAEHLRRKA